MWWAHRERRWLRSFKNKMGRLGLGGANLDCLSDSGLGLEVFMGLAGLFSLWNGGLGG